MPTTYASQELKAACESPSGMTPDRRNLLYHVTCPLSQEPCTFHEECEYGQCQAATDPEQESEIFITVYPHPGVPHPPHDLENFQDYMIALTEAMLMLDQSTVQKVMNHVQQENYSPEQLGSLQITADGVMAILQNPDLMETKACKTCHRDHISANRDCFRCERVLRHPASRNQDRD